MVREILPAGQIVRRVAAEARAAIEQRLAPAGALVCFRPFVARTSKTPAI